MSRTALVLLAAGALAACRPDCTPRAGAPPVVVFVTVDTLRADHLGSYGSVRMGTPALDRLAAEGVRFARSYAASNTTLPSHTSLLTSLPVARHGVVSNARATPARSEMLPAVLRAAGYRTAAFVSARHLGPASVFGTLLDGLERFDAPRRVSRPRRADETVDAALDWIAGACHGPSFAWIHLWDPHMPYDPPAPFDRAYYDGDPRAETHQSLASAEFDWALHDMRPATSRLRETPGLLRRLKAELGVGSKTAKRIALSPPELRAHARDQTTYRRLLAELRPVLSDLHRTLPFNAELAGMLTGVRDVRYPRALYAGEVSYVDQALGRLVATLESWGLRGRLIVVVTGDHGEGLGEHAVYFNHIGLWEEIVRVPLVVWAPGRVAPAVRTDPASGLDVTPTVLRLVDVSVPAAMEGKDLLTVARPDRVLVVESLLGLQVALLDGDWKLVRTLHDYYATTAFHREAGALELYDLGRDPGERTDVIASTPERLAGMRAHLDAWLADHGVHVDEAATPDVPPIAPEDRGRLRALGYVE